MSTTEGTSAPEKTGLLLGEGARARDLLVYAPFATTGKRQIEEYEAEQDRQLTIIDGWVEAPRRMRHEVSNGHIASENECDWAREKAEEDEKSSGQLKDALKANEREE